MQFTGWDNPMGTDGFEFIEYAAPDPAALGKLFETMGFMAVARHRHKKVTLYRQGGVNFIINAEPDSFATALRAASRTIDLRDRVSRARCGTGIPTRARTWRLGIRLTIGADGVEHSGDQGHRRFADLLRRPLARQELQRHQAGSATSISTTSTSSRSLGAQPNPTGCGLTYIDHLTHNVHRGRMKEWAEFYERLFNFREVRYFDIEGQLTGLKSKAMTSPCGKIRIPINESSDDKSQIVEYLDEYRGEGIQHVALATSDIYATVRAMKQNGVAFQDTIDTYYDLIDTRLPNHGEHARRVEAAAHLDRRRDASRCAERAAAADLYANRHRPDIFRDHSTQRRRGVRRRQLPRVVRIDRARSDPARRTEARRKQGAR